MFRAPASGGAASLSRCCSIFTWVGRQRAQGIHRMCPGRRRSKRVPRCGSVCVRIPGSNGVRQRVRWFHRTRPWRGAPSAHACCRPGIPRPCASTETGYPNGVRVSGNARGRWRQGSGWFPFACVAQRYARRQPGHAVQSRSSLRNRKRALHNKTFGRFHPSFRVATAPPPYPAKPPQAAGQFWPFRAPTH